MTAQLVGLIAHAVVTENRRRVGLIPAGRRVWEITWKVSYKGKSASDDDNDTAIGQLCGKCVHKGSR